MLPRQIGVLLHIDNLDLFEAQISDRYTPESQAFFRGVTATELELHRLNLDLARTGSPAAVETAHSYIEHLNNTLDL
jgi:hypothetical protein